MNEGVRVVLSRNAFRCKVLSVYFNSCCVHQFLSLMLIEQLTISHTNVFPPLPPLPSPLPPPPPLSPPLPSTLSPQRKCEQYWPDNVNDTFTPSGSSITVLMTELQAFADYEIRKFLVTDVRIQWNLSIMVTVSAGHLSITARLLSPKWVYSVHFNLR